MANHQLKMLQSLLRITRGSLPQHRLEEIQVALETHLQLYLQEKDKEGAKVFQELKKMIHNKTVAEIEKLAVMDETVQKTPLSIQQKHANVVRVFKPVHKNPGHA